MKVLVDDLASQLLPRDQCPDYDDSAEKDNYDSDLFTFRSRCIRISNKVRKKGRLTFAFSPVNGKKVRT